MQNAVNDGSMRAFWRQTAVSDMRGESVVHDPSILPADLPIPRDDGAADHLPGAVVPELGLPSTCDLGRRQRSISALSRR